MNVTNEKEKSNEPAIAGKGDNKVEDHANERLLAESPETPHVTQQETSFVFDESYEKMLQLQKINILQTFRISLLLVAPLLMGLAINAVAASEEIKMRFLTLMKIKIENGIFELPNNIWTFNVTFPLGGLIGALLCAQLVEVYGRKKTTVSFAILMLVSQVIKILSYQVHIAFLFVGRFGDGIGSAALMVCTISWLFELLTPKVQNFYKPLIQILINTGICLQQVLCLKYTFAKNWDMVYLLPLILCLLLILISIWLPESPKWIYKHNKNEEKAIKSLKQVRKDSFLIEEWYIIKNEVDKYSRVETASIKQLISKRLFWGPIASSIAIQLGQQLTGINIIGSFSNDLLKQSNIPNADIYGLVILIAGLVSSVIFAPLVGSYQRKFMLMIGYSGMGISFCLIMILTAFKANNVAKVIIYAFYFSIFQIGPGPLAWFISLEIYPVAYIAAAQGLCTGANWIGNTLVYLAFPLLNKAISVKTLYVFIVTNILVLIYIYFFVEETLGKTPEVIIDKTNKRYTRMKLLQ